MHSDNLVGAVVIGRNEGERLVRCLSSVRGAACVVYVDSGSSDGSVESARRVGAEVVCLDLADPFTAARARNAGFRRLMQLRPDLRYVQFIDGDCELVRSWTPSAIAYLEQQPGYAVACGRRRERNPDRSIYNRLCDLEWNTPVGEARSCGGDALIRVEAFRQVGGFRDNLIAGEEPELCVRLRAAGWRIRRLPCEMTMHDAAMTRWIQWWRREVRAGHAFAEGASLHGRPPERHWRRETARAVVWGAALPAGALALSAVAGPWALAILLAYPIQIVRLARLPGGWPHAFFLVAGKFAECWGVLRFWRSHWHQQVPRIIEYK